MARAKNIPVKIPPGIVKSEGGLAASGRYVDGDKFRFANKRPQKIGGWEKLVPQTFSGIARAIHSWNDLGVRSLVAVGTTEGLYVAPTLNSLQNITPAGFTAGLVDPAYAYGWGVGGWGSSTWGTPRARSSILKEPFYWSLGNFGKLLLASPFKGALYQYDPTNTTITTAQPVAASQAPGAMRGFWVTPERFVIGYGTSSDTTPQVDAMQLWWCHQGDLNTWTPSATNTANRRRLTQGQKIMAGDALGQGDSLIWTDSALYLHRFTGSRFVFDTRLVGTSCGLAGPSAYCLAGGRAFWFGSSGFHQYAGGLGTIPNAPDVAEWVLAQIRPLYDLKTVAYYNQRYHEIWFFFVSGSATQPGTYVAVNIDDWTWIAGTMERTAALRSDPVSGDARPVLAATNGYLYRHEAGKDGDGAAIDSWVRSAPFQLDDGGQNLQVLGFAPDFGTHVGNVEIEVDAYDRSETAQIDTNTVQVPAGYGIADLRLSGRLASFKIRSNELGGDWRLGAPSFEVRTGGRRR